MPDRMDVIPGFTPSRTRTPFLPVLHADRRAIALWLRSKAEQGAPITISPGLAREVADVIDPPGAHIHIEFRKPL